MNYIKIPFQFIMESTNDYVIQPTLNASEVCAKSTNDYVIKPINETIIIPCKSILKFNETTPTQITQIPTQTQIEKQKFVRFSVQHTTNFVDYSDDIITEHSINSLNSLNSLNSINSHNSINSQELSDEELKCIKCYHLKKNNQTYFQHLGESLSYSGRAFKASFYFFIHAFIPDLFEYNGSATLYSLTDTIKTKYTSNLEEVNNE